MNKYATAYINFFQNKIKAQVFQAENSIDAMKTAIIYNNINDENVKNWVENLSNLTEEQFKDEVSSCDILIDATKIIN